MNSNRLLEICVDNFDSALKAVLGGANRLEVCSSLSEGGLTPTIGLIKLIKEELPDATVFVMVRCKSGSDFIFSDADLRVMIADVDSFKRANVDGFVFGALKGDGTVDEVSCRRIVDAASPLPVTFHRAFDVCSNPSAALETLVEIGFSRILTSGQQLYAASDKGCALIKAFVETAKERIIIMPGGGIRPDNVKKVLATGVREVHASCLVERKDFSTPKLNMGKAESGIIYTIDQSSVEAISAIVKNFSLD